MLVATLPIADDAPTPAFLEQLLRETMEPLLAEPDRRRGPGRPEILPAAALWSAFTIGVLTGDLSQVAIWRRLVDPHWWYRGVLQISKEAVYHRLDCAGPSPIEPLFEQMTLALLARRAIVPGYESLATWANEIVALDESTLDKVARKTPELRELPSTSSDLLGGKITAVFDLRRQLLRRVLVHDNGKQNERKAARDAVADLPTKSLIVSDLGYFGFAWFDHLTNAGQYWVSRCRKGTSYSIRQVLYQDETTLDALVWLGAHRADRAQHQVRLIQFEHHGVLRSYLTNVLQPEQLSIAAVATLYARRWDIELVFKLAKNDLHLEVLWSAKPAVIRHQVWAVLLITQLILAARTEVAVRARVLIDEVSLPLLVKYLPKYALYERDPIGAYATIGEKLGFIRPSRRIVVDVPVIPLASIDPPPFGPPVDRVPRYAGKQ